MLNNEIDLTYYSKVIEMKRKDRESAYRITVTDILNKKEKQENTLLSNYRVGNWKTKEIFIYGVIGKKKIANKYISYVKGIPVELVNKLNLNKHDILRIRLKDDIIWLEKIDDINQVEFKWLSKILNYNDYYLYLTVPSIITNNIKITIINTQENADIIKVDYSTLIKLPRSIIINNDLQPDEKLYCRIIGNYLSIEKISNNNEYNKVLFCSPIFKISIKNL